MNVGLALRARCVSALRPPARGFSLLEMVVAIIVVAIGVAGVFAAFLAAVQGSADPLITKQMVTLAEGMMEEVLARPLLGDGVRPTASAPCPDRRAFDEVADFDGVTWQGICHPDGTQEHAPQGDYRTQVTVASSTAFGPSGATLPAVQITVTVTSPQGKTVRLVAYRLL